MRADFSLTFITNCTVTSVRNDTGVGWELAATGIKSIASLMSHFAFFQVVGSIRNDGNGRTYSITVFNVDLCRHSEISLEEIKEETVKENERTVLLEGEGLQSAS
mgnify:CR=1 FL=1